MPSNEGYAISIGNECAANQLLATKYGLADLCVGALPSDSEWHHISVVFSETGVVGYADGSVIGSSANTQNFITSTAPFLIGVNHAENNKFFDGLIDEVRIYNRALSPAEVKQLYLMGGGVKINDLNLEQGESLLMFCRMSRNSVPCLSYMLE